ncbi:hypothetical protein [Dapis sp. BLCC M229]
MEISFYKTSSGLIPLSLRISVSLSARYFSCSARSSTDYITS